MPNQHGTASQTLCTDHEVMIFLPFAVTYSLVCKMDENYGFIDNVIQSVFVNHLVSFVYSVLPTEIPDKLRRTARAHFALLLKFWMCLSLTIILSSALLLPLALTLSYAVRIKA